MLFYNAAVIQHPDDFHLSAVQRLGKVSVTSSGVSNVVFSTGWNVFDKGCHVSFK